jgi:hypothetical protein
MGRDRYHEDLYLGGFNSIDDTPLDAKSRGAMPGPLP